MPKEQETIENEEEGDLDEGAEISESNAYVPDELNEGTEAYAY